MLTLYSESFITAARMDGFSYVQGPATNTLPADGPGVSATRPKSALARFLAALPLVIRPRP